ncbi:MAG: DNA mismatch repair protein MutS [Armatimonadota bacterium]|nr:DNA mismatch repair protein MutS [Armatimonadota bacterium]MDR7453384.1 DNA mismatch repair protein MutS [Armatimonadota bacterium]MDR7457203.1 DNA mismatch repair protein MutS [Armatimonadota bacterium]MDR7496056.1 DNA mismatch repair protein MutS [Armatimonadota bacterium]MDR7512054.1 DNA mismatch repair protein MutS [Armatimonadota bacterium]
MAGGGVLTPMMRQYQDLKARHPGALLMFRLGDFYELFFDDAVTASRELEIVLTSREIGKGRRVPMCGVPYHALDSYLARLVDRGYRVAICDQVEDPRRARGLVRREVTRVVTPGTVMDAAALEAREPRYLAALVEAGGAWGLAAADLTTGDFRTTQIAGAEADARLAEELARFRPREVVVPDGASATWPLPAGAARTPIEPWRFEAASARRALIEHLRVASLEGFGVEDLPLATAAAGALLQYLQQTQRSTLAHVRGLRLYDTEHSLGLDETTQRNLELFRNRRDGTTAHTLLGVLDHTLTAMGGRLLREWMLRPLVDPPAIRARLVAVEAALGDRGRRVELRGVLRGVPDLARLVGRIGHGSATARDLVALRAGLERLPKLREGLTRLADPRFAALAGAIDPHETLAALIGRAVVDDPPVGLREGGMIRDGYDATLDAMRAAAADGRAWIAGLEAAERERTGIRSLRVGFNKVFGYYIEVSNPNRHLVPANYIRKQTLVGAERYITPEMKEREAAILGAEERMAEVEYELFVALCDRVAASAQTLLATAAAVAEADVILALAEAAERGGYVRPDVVEEPVLEIRAGRHPVVERLLEGERFVPNDLRLDVADRALLIVTGPNMAGKSTLLRQAALILIMAQMGSFVPAAVARVGVADRVFTRVGATDDLAGGRSTFLVEMQEVARILSGATRRSLVVLDEVGRGTSTYDGMSLAWAVVHHLHEHVGARTLFATHFHELTELAGLLPRVHNISMRVREDGETIVFLHSVADGGADRSYGLHVARLAGIPDGVIDEARRILAQLEAAAARPREPDAPPVPSRAGRARQLPLALELTSPVEEALLALSLESMTPLEALRALAELRDRVRTARESARAQDRRRVQ